MALAPRTVQNMPDCLRRTPTMPCNRLRARRNQRRTLVPETPGTASGACWFRSNRPVGRSPPPSWIEFRHAGRRLRAATPREVQFCRDPGDPSFHGRHPAFLRRRVVWIKQCGYIPQVLPGRIEIDDLDGAREVPIGEVPDPDSAIANDDFGRGPLPASAPSLGIYAVAELVGDFDGAHISGRIRIANGPAILIHGSLRKHAAEFAFAGAGSLSFDSASPALGFRRPRRGSGRHPSAHTFLEWSVGNDGQDELFGAVDFLLVPPGDFRANALSRPFDGLAGTSRPAKPASVRGPARTASRRPASPPCALHRVKTPARQYPVRHRQDAVLWSNVNTGSRDAGPRQCRPPKERTWPAFP